MRLVELLREGYIYNRAGWIMDDGNFRDGAHWEVIRDRARELTGQQEPHWSYTMGYRWGWIRVFQHTKEMGVEFQTDTVTRAALKELHQMAMEFLDQNPFNRIVYFEYGTEKEPRKNAAFTDPRLLRRFLAQFRTAMIGGE